MPHPPRTHPLPPASFLGAGTEAPPPGLEDQPARSGPVPRGDLVLGKGPARKRPTGLPVCAFQRPLKWRERRKGLGPGCPSCSRGSGWAGSRPRTPGSLGTANDKVPNKSIELLLLQTQLPPFRGFVSSKTQ